MAVKWIASRFEGVRYREHSARKHGVRFDRYFTIRFRVDGKSKEEALGWSSEGWTEAKAAAERARLQTAKATGEGAVTLQERREKAKEKRMEHEEAEKRALLDRLTFAEFWTDTYLKVQNKGAKSIRREEDFFRLWIRPAIGDKPLKDVSPFLLEKLKRTMIEAGQSPRSVSYCLDVVRQVFRTAARLNRFHGKVPTSEVTKPKRDNRRVRFLSQDEADRLLEALKAKSADLYQTAVIALHTGMRAGEIHALTWGDVDLPQGILTLRDTKSGRTRFVYLTEAAKAILQEREKGEPSAFVFPDRKGRKRTGVSKVFERTVNELGFNLGVADRRQRVCFHSLRHTFASWLACNGTPLHTIQRLLGHQTIALTERYSHLLPDHFREAVKLFDKSAGDQSRDETVFGRA